jgi:hypothetical protein
LPVGDRDLARVQLAGDGVGRQLAQLDEHRAQRLGATVGSLHLQDGLRPQATEPLALRLQLGERFPGTLADQPALPIKVRLGVLRPLLLQKHPARQHVGRLQPNRADFQLRLLPLFAGLEVEIFEGCFRNLTCSCFCDRQS